MSDLKPCPFCGGNEVKLYIDDGLGVFSYYYEIVCRHCGLNNKSIYANRDRVENAAIKHWNTRPIEDALRKEIAKLQAENRSLVEQMNQTALKPNQEVIEWHKYPDEKPEKTGYYIIYYTILNRVAFDFWHNDEQEWDKYGEYLLAWAYLPKGVIND